MHGINKSLSSHVYNSTYIINNNNYYNLYMQLKAREQQGANVPLIRIKSDQFAIKKLEENCKVKDFRCQHDLDANEDNLFVEFGWVELEKKENLMHDVKDAILMDKVEKLL